MFQVVKILFAVAIFISYNLQFYVAADIMWSGIYRSSKYLQELRSIDKDQIVINTASRSFSQNLKAKLYPLYENLFRVALVIFTFILAVNVPRIDLFISLVGSIASSTLAIIIPPIMDHIVFYESTNRSKLRLLKNVLIILFGVYIFVAGTYVSINDIVDYLRGK
jgi:proton-coupled amino acid transporter